MFLITVNETEDSIAQGLCRVRLPACEGEDKSWKIMGQAFRRASGKIRASSGIDATSSAPKPRTTIDRPPPVVPTSRDRVSDTTELGKAPHAGNFSYKASVVLVGFVGACRTSEKICALLYF